MNKAANAAGDTALAAGGSVSADQRTLDADRLRGAADAAGSGRGLQRHPGQAGHARHRADPGHHDQDVTETLVDLDARLATQRASVDRVRALLAKAQHHRRSRLDRVRADPARGRPRFAGAAQGQAGRPGRAVHDHADLRGPAARRASPVEPETGFLAGLQERLVGLPRLGEGRVLTIAGWLLPCAIAIGIPVWLVVAILAPPPPSPAAR